MTKRTVAQLIDATRFDDLKTAIVATFRSQFAGVTVVAHPGMLDINDVVAKAVVAVPGIAIGWSRSRTVGHADGAGSMTLDFVAYILAGDMAIGLQRRVDRDVAAHAIGSGILDILADPELHHFGMERLERPSSDPGPELRPVFTAKSWTEGVCYYAVTWQQTLWRERGSLFGGKTPALTPDPNDRTAVDIEVGGGELPIEIQAVLGRFQRGEDI